MIILYGHCIMLIPLRMVGAARYVTPKRQTCKNKFPKKRGINMKSHPYRAVRRALLAVWAEDDTTEVAALRAVTLAQLRAYKLYPLSLVRDMLAYARKLQKRGI